MGHTGQSKAPRLSDSPQATLLLPVGEPKRYRAMQCLAYLVEKKHTGLNILQSTANLSNVES